MKNFSEVKKNFGFGCMRLPMIDGAIDESEFCEMIDTFMQNGFNYFDTAHGYHNGLSEKALCKCLTSRYPRDSYLLTNKLSSSYFKTEEEIRPLFEKQLELCGVDILIFILCTRRIKSFLKSIKNIVPMKPLSSLKKRVR